MSHETAPSIEGQNSAEHPLAQNSTVQAKISQLVALASTGVKGPFYNPENEDQE